MGDFTISTGIDDTLLFKQVSISYLLKSVSIIRYLLKPVSIIRYLLKPVSIIRYLLNPVSIIRYFLKLVSIIRYLLKPVSIIRSIPISLCPEMGTSPNLVRTREFNSRGRFWAKTDEILWKI